MRLCSHRCTALRVRQAESTPNCLASAVLSRPPAKMAGMTRDELNRIEQCRANSAWLIGQTRTCLRQAEELYDPSQGESLDRLILETRAMCAATQKIMAESRRLLSVARVQVFLAGRD